MGTLQVSLAALLFSYSLAPAAELKITLLATTDLHGNLFPYDYYTAQPAERGLGQDRDSDPSRARRKPQQSADRLRRHHPGNAARSGVSGERPAIRGSSAIR
jgi:hypothetical protein